MSRIRVSDLPLRSTVPGVRYPALSDAHALPILAYLYQLERAQWMDPAHHRALIFRQLDTLLRLAHEKVAYYHFALNDAGYDPAAALDEDAWSSVPILQRQTLQTETKRLISTDIPQSFQPFNRIKSSGSTGMPVEVFHPAIKAPMMSATAVLEPLIHGADFMKKNASIRYFREGDKGPEGIRRESWGGPVSALVQTGPMAALHSGLDPEQHADWVIREEPAYLQAFPSIFEAILPILKDKGATLPGLHYFRTTGEQLPDRLREDARDMFGARIVDAYSSQEVGLIALQCPDTDHYHLVHDMVFTEILREDGTPCAPGEIGRVVVTDLFNPAFPLIRYEVGDYAEMAAPCPCGRSWPTITRVMGRVRNLITHPDGQREWPAAPSKLLIEAIPMRQYQIIQTSPTELKANFVMKRPMTEEDRHKAVEIIHERLGEDFAVDVFEVDTIERGASGKYEEFRSEVTPEMIAAAKGSSR